MNVASTRNRLETRLSSLRAHGDHGLAPFVMAGDGGLQTTLAILKSVEEAGAVCVELGLPFSDPIADGPVLQAAAARALGAGTTVDSVLAMLSEFRETSALPVVVMTYANPLISRGWDAATRAIAAAGGDGLIVADLPVDEGDEMAACAISAGLAPIFFVSPTTSAARATRAVRASRGFVYAIGRFGVTGVATDLDAPTQAFLARVAREADGLPVAVGFGIATAQAVTAALRHADLAIVGSALTARIQSEPSSPPAASARAFVRELVKGIPPCTLP
jgi:tryptophan synthase alpha chain